MQAPGSLLLSILRRGFWCNSYFMFIEVGSSCRIQFSVVSYLYVSFSRLSTSAWEERAYFSAIDYLYLYMSLVVRKPVFGVSDQVRHKPGCTTTEDGWRLEISYLESRWIELSV